MCTTCGCSGEEHEGFHHHDDAHAHGHAHPHDHAHHDHAHPHVEAEPRTITLERAVLAKNDRLAATTRASLAADGALMLNLVSSPGSGKTTLLERTIRDVGAELRIAVIEGDQATDRDAARIRAAGARAVQVNTGVGCHLDAAMVARALRELEPPRGATVLIENVGNLVCPALFDLGERAKVVVASVTEGEDKPIKYPHMFRAGALVLLNKVDLLPHLTFDVARFEAHVREVNPRARVLAVSATRGDGLGAFYEWLRGEARAAAAKTTEATP